MYRLWIIVAALFIFIGCRNINFNDLELKENENQSEQLEERIKKIFSNMDIIDSKEEFINYVNKVFVDPFLEMEEDSSSGKMNSGSSEEISNSLESVTLLYAIDGDTVVVKDKNEKEITVRMIGIDTPESVHVEEEKNNIWGEKASVYTKELLNDYMYETVFLEYDIEKSDDYGRTLAYVWLTDSTDKYENMVNVLLVKNGYAVNKEFIPNIKYASILEENCDIAKNNGIGLWENKEFATLW